MASQPLIGKIAAFAMIYEVMIQIISVGVDDKSDAIFGSETLTTDESNTDINVAKVNIKTETYGESIFEALELEEFGFIQNSLRLGFGFWLFVR